MDGKETHTSIMHHSAPLHSDWGRDALILLKIDENLSPGETRDGDEKEDE